MGLNRDIADALTSAGIDVQKYAEFLRRQLLGQLTFFEGDFKLALDRADIETPRNLAKKLSRANRLIRDLDVFTSRAYSSVARVERAALISFARAHSGRVAQILGVKGKLTVEQATTLVDNLLVIGKTRVEIWTHEARVLSSRMYPELRVGVTGGEPNALLVKRVLGDGTNKRLAFESGGEAKRARVFVGGAMQPSRTGAGGWTRTSVQAVANRITQDLIRGHPEKFRGMMASVTLDSGTTDLCISRSGAMWSLDGEPIGNSTTESYPGEPPWHFKCRTFLVPLDINDPELPLEESYSEWLKRQPVEQQIAALGRGKRDLWLAGLITLTQLVDVSGQPMTLAELEQNSQ